MAGRLEGKVAFITGAARGQGRSHAVRLAEEGADIIALDVCEAVRSNVAPAASKEDLDETVRLVEATGRKIVASIGDIRDFDLMSDALKDGVETLGRLDIVCANAGTWTIGRGDQLTEQEWRDILDVNLTGAWNTARAAIPILKEQGTGGSIILTSSGMGLRAFPNLAHYTAAKHGVVGLTKALALELGESNIRVNSVNPGTVNTPLAHNPLNYKLFAPELDNPNFEEIRDRFEGLTVFPGVPHVEPIDISNAVLFLASDEARYVTGVALPVDAGSVIK